MHDPRSDPQYPIRVVAARTGVSAHALRAWERRHAAVTPVRRGQARLYSGADIDRIRLLRRLTEAGHGISHVAPLSDAELRTLLADDPAPRSEPAPLEEPAPVAAAGVDAHVTLALDALHAMDGPRMYAVLMRAVVALPAHAFTHGVAIPLLWHVGELWKAGTISPAHEHLLSAQLVRVLAWLADSVPVPPGAPVAVAVAPGGQRHEFGAMLSAIVAAEEGWRVTYLGADLPAADIATAVRVSGAAALLLSAVFPGQAILLDEVRRLRSALPTGVHILIGGQGAAECRTEVEHAGARWLPDLDALRRVLRALPTTRGDG